MVFDRHGLRARVAWPRIKRGSCEVAKKKRYGIPFSILSVIGFAIFKSIKLREIANFNLK